MKAIFKFKLLPERTQKIVFPKESRVLSAGAQGEDIFIWAMVDRETIEKEVREIVVLATGDRFHEDQAQALELINTVQMDSGLVFHVFEKKGYSAY